MRKGIAILSFLCIVVVFFLRRSITSPIRAMKNFFLRIEFLLMGGKCVYGQVRDFESGGSDDIKIQFLTISVVTKQNDHRWRE